MPRGAWDTNGFPTTWWDVDGNVAGWWDKDAIPFPTAAFGDEPPPAASNRLFRRTAPYQVPSDDFVPTTFAIDDQGPVNLAPIIYERAPIYLAPEENVTLPLPISDEGFVPQSARPFHIRAQFPVPSEDFAVAQIIFDEGPVPSVLHARPLHPAYTFDIPEWVPPKPVPPKPPRPQPQRSITPKETGGNAVFLTGVQLACVPNWMLTFYDEPKEEKEEEAEYAIMHVAPQGAAVKALAPGVVERHVDTKGRESVVLNADDGTRYWYADVGTTDVEDGARVRAGETVAHTKPNAQPLPDMIAPRSGPKLLLSASREKPEEMPKTRPAQVVFVEPPREEMYPATKKYVRLIPLADPPPNEEVLHVPTTTTAGNLLRVLAPIGVVAAIMLAISMFEQKPKPKKRKKKRRR